MGIKEHSTTSMLQKARRVSLILGILLLFIGIAFPNPTELNDKAFRVALVGIVMATWWILETLPLPVTSLIPLAAFPLANIGSMNDAATPYANPLIFLFLGGFMLALAVEKWQLHRRLALGILLKMGARCERVVGGFLIATAFLSMWVNNTATAMMMLPIGLSVIEVFKRESPELGPRHRSFGVALMLAIAYGASLGGMGTLVGSPPNLIFAGYMREAGYASVDFLTWFLIGFPLVLIIVPLTWLYLVKWLFPMGDLEFPGGAKYMREEYQKLGPITRPELLTAGVGIATAICWITAPLLKKQFPHLQLEDAGIAIFATILLFIIPVDYKKREFLLDWETARKIPWEILLQFGGGLSLAAAISDSGLAVAIGESLKVFSGAPLFLIVAMVTLITIFFSEVSSNTATAAAFLPIVGPLAIALGYPPLILTTPLAFAASCGFMLPIATPPNAIVFSGKHLKVDEMVRAGFLLDILAAALVSAIPFFILHALNLVH